MKMKLSLLHPISLTSGRLWGTVQEEVEEAITVWVEEQKRSIDMLVPQIYAAMPRDKLGGGGQEDFWCLYAVQHTVLLPRDLLTHFRICSGREGW